MGNRDLVSSIQSGQQTVRLARGIEPMDSEHAVMEDA